MGLLPTIGQHAILQILLFQIGHVYKRHPAGVEAEHEHVPGIVHGRHQVQITNLPNHLGRHSPLDCLVNAGIDVLERVSLHGEFLLDRTVIHGTKIPHVERRTVRTNAIGLQVALIFHHQVDIQFVKRDVPVDVPESDETVERGGIGFCRALFSHLPHLCNQPFAKRKKPSLPKEVRKSATTSSEVNGLPAYASLDKMSFKRATSDLRRASKDCK